MMWIFAFLVGAGAAAYPYKCANEGERCHCTGVVVYGKRYAGEGHGNVSKEGGELDFKGMEMFALATKPGRSGGIMCTNSELTDPTYRQFKQCFCAASGYEPPRHRAAQAHVCANEGELCKCKGGKVFYGKRYNNAWKTKTEGGVMPFAKMLLWRYDVRMMEESGSGSEILCNNVNFEDPLHGFAKHCYCKYNDIQGRSLAVSDGIYYMGTALVLVAAVVVAGVTVWWRNKAGFAVISDDNEQLLPSNP